MGEGNFSLQAQWEGKVGEGMRQQQVNSKKIYIASLISSIMYLLARHIKAELVSEVPQLGFREYIF
jgi:hypothetical protein